MSAPQPIGPGSTISLPHDLSDTSSAQQNLTEFDRTSLDTDVPPIDARKLCILGLPWDTTDDELQDYFATFGPLESAAIIRKSRTGESRGFGFVTYQSASDAQMVLLQEHSIGGRHIDAKQALPRGSSNPNRETRLFIGKLPAELTDVELREHFENFGRVQDAYIPKDATNGKQGHRGFGFVTFANADDVDKVLQCAHTIGNADVAVQCAVPKDKTLEMTARSAGIGKTWPFPLAESYTSSNDSLTTIGVPGPSIYGSIGSGIPHHPGTVPSMWAGNRGTLKAQPPAIPDRMYAREQLYQPGMASTSGREQQPYPGTNRIPGFAAHSQLEQSLSGSQRSSLDYTPSKRHGQAEAFRNSTDAATQALQGLNFGGNNQHNLGLSLALLQQAQQANENQQNLLSSRFLQSGVPSGSGHPQQSSLGINRGMPATQSSYQPSNLGRLPGAASQSSSMNPNSMAFTPRSNSLGGAGSIGAGTFGGFSGMAGPPDARAGPRMFVGKLNKDINEQDIKDYMSQFGYVLDVYMPRDKVKRSEHRGFGFVTFETTAAIERVALNAPHRIKGSIVVVDEAAPRREDIAEVGMEPSSSLMNDAMALADTYVPDLSLPQSGQTTARFGTTASIPTTIGSPSSSHYLNGLAGPQSGPHGLDAAHQLFLNKQSSLDNNLGNMRHQFQNGQNVHSSQPGAANYTSF